MIIQKFRRVYWIIANKISISKKRLSHGARLKINGVLFVYGRRGSIEIGDDVIINSDKRYNTIGGDVRTVLYTSGEGRILIGNNVGISNSTFVAIDEIRIEDNVLIGGSVRVYDNDFHSINYVERLSNTGIKKGKVLIKEGAFIGAGSIILKGVTVGKHSVVGAGSVVTKNIPDGEIWAGNPARKIKDAD